MVSGMVSGVVSRDDLSAIAVIKLTDLSFVGFLKVYLVSFLHRTKLVS